MNTETIAQFDTLTPEALFDTVGGRKMGMHSEYGGGSGGQPATGGFTLNDIYNFIRRP